MKYIFLNLKRFDVPAAAGGVNRIADVAYWGKFIIESVQDSLGQYNDTQFVIFLPEAHILGAKSALKPSKNLFLGSQSVHFANVSPGGNFGAYTTSRPAAAIAALGCEWTIIGHCEERNSIKTVLAEAGVTDMSAVNRILNKKVKCAIESGLRVLYCVGENADEQPMKEQVLKAQLNAIAEFKDVVIGYEPVWAIGPGKTPPDAAYINEIAQYIKSVTDSPVVYGGGLKTENAPMIAGIDRVNGGLIALTRFAGEIGFYPAEYLEIIEKYEEVSR